MSAQPAQVAFPFGTVLLLAIFFAPKYTFNGMAWCVVISQTVAVVGIFLVLRYRKLNPLAMASNPSYA